MEGWIKLHRSVLEWEWYSDSNTFRVFIHLLIKANSKDASWRGEDINRGQLITSIAHLSEELRLSPKQIRISISKLKRTNEVITERANNATRITITKYDSYQSKQSLQGQTIGQTIGQLNGEERANQGQTKGNKQELKEVKELKKLKEDIKGQSNFEKSVLKIENKNKLTSNIYQDFSILEKIENRECLEFLSSESWFESKAMQMKIEVDILTEKAKEFLIDVRDRDLLEGKSLIDLRSHFVSWFKLKQKSENTTSKQNYLIPEFTDIK